MEMTRSSHEWGEAHLLGQSILEDCRAGDRNSHNQGTRVHGDSCLKPFQLCYIEYALLSCSLNVDVEIINWSIEFSGQKLVRQNAY